MKKMILGAIAAATLLSTAPLAIAAQTDTKAASQITRIVIAPPKSPLAATIKSGLADAYYAARPESKAYKEAQKLYFFYGARHFEPLWLTEADDKIIFSRNAKKIIDVFKKANLSGLDPADYLVDEINLDLIDGSPAAMAKLETAFSTMAARYANDLHAGRISPRQVSRNITVLPDRIDDAEMLIKLNDSQDPAALLADLEPKHREYRALKAALASFDEGAAEEQVTVPDGKLLRPGKSDKRVPILRERLGVAVPKLEDGTLDSENAVYDKALVAAVEGFQKDMDLLVDGVIGPATVAALNGGGATSREDIVANMEMWRWLPPELGDFKVVVNIPEFRLAIMKGEDIVHSTRVVVGKNKHQTPVFSDEIEHVVVNPYWNVPPSIARNEIGPIVARNPGYIAAKNMELLSGGRVVNASAIDWSSTSINNFRIRQRPGRGNALGSVKFLFPNRHNVYLHDTPSKSLFNRSYRAFSHGCVRVHNPWEFAQALLREEPKITIASLEGQRGSRERWNNLDRHIPVHLVYLTLRVDQQGEIRSYGDVYGHMKKLKALLAE